MDRYGINVTSAIICSYILNISSWFGWFKLMCVAQTPTRDRSGDNSTKTYQSGPRMYRSNTKIKDRKRAKNGTSNKRRYRTVVRKVKVCLYRTRPRPRPRLCGVREGMV